MAYPGVTSDVKAHRWNSVCVHVLIYMHGMDGIPINNTNIKKLDTIQGNLRQALGLSKRAHTTDLLLSLYINRIPNIHVLNNNIASLFNRIFNISIPFFLNILYATWLYLAL